MVKRTSPAEYYIGHFTKQEFIDSLEKTTEQIPWLLREYPDLDEDLQLAYEEQLMWLMRQAYHKLKEHT